MAKDAITLIALIVFVAAIPDILEAIADRVRDLLRKGDDSEKEP